MRCKILLLSAVLMLTLSGCGTKALLIRPGVTCTTASKIQRVDAYVPDEKGNLVRAVIEEVPAGTLFKVPSDEVSK